MMSLYDVFPDNDKASLVFSSDEIVTMEDLKPFSFKGVSQPDWKPVKFKWKSKADKYRSANDFIIVHNNVGVGVVITEKAKNILESVLKADAEYLPIEIDSETKPFYLLNVLNVIENALDLDKSEFDTLRNGDRGGVKKSVFAYNNIPNNRIFIYPESIRAARFKGDLLKKTCEQNGLTGLTFRPLKNFI